jgi:hypothetical protein
VLNLTPTHPGATNFTGFQEDRFDILPFEFTRNKSYRQSIECRAEHISEDCAKQIVASLRCQEIGAPEGTVLNWALQTALILDEQRACSGLTGVKCEDSPRRFRKNPYIVKIQAKIAFLQIGKRYANS